jgi:hypothetical protein
MKRTTKPKAIRLFHAQDCDSFLKGKPCKEIGDQPGTWIPDDPELVERAADALADQCRTTGWWAPKRLAVAAIRAVSPLLLKGHK